MVPPDVFLDFPNFKSLYLERANELLVESYTKMSVMTSSFPMGKPFVATRSFRGQKIGKIEFLDVKNSDISV